MKIYLAAHYGRRQELVEKTKQLLELAHSVTSRWLDGSHQLPHDSTESEILHLRAQWATIDLEDIFQADILVCFTEQQPYTGHPGSGGRHVEFGYALALGLYLIIVGPRESVFHCHSGTVQFDNWEDALTYLRRFAP